MNTLFLTKLLAYVALALTLLVLCTSILLLFQSRKKGGPIAALALSCITGYMLMGVVMRLSLGFMCYRPVWQTVLLYGGVIALLIWTLYDCTRQLRAECACKRAGDRHDR